MHSRRYLFIFLSLVCLTLSLYRYHWVIITTIWHKHQHRVHPLLCHKHLSSNTTREHLDNDDFKRFLEPYPSHLQSNGGLVETAESR